MDDEWDAVCQKNIHIYPCFSQQDYTLRVSLVQIRFSSYVLPLVLHYWGTASHAGTVGTKDIPAELQWKLGHAHTNRILSCK